MYAVVKSGGKQYRVEQGDTIRVEKLDAQEGAELNLDQVLMLSDGDRTTLGAPLVHDAKVAVKVKSHGRGPKIKIVKFRRRKHHHKTQGHRQAYTELEITGISGGETA